MRASITAARACGSSRIESTRKWDFLLLLAVVRSKRDTPQVTIGCGNFCAECGARLLTARRRYLGRIGQGRGKIVSASLSKTSFTAAQAKTVKLAYKISPASKHFGYLLSLKKGAKWVKVRSVSKTGNFKGSYSMTVKALFGSTAIKVGQYRVKISADANSITRTFTVVKTSSPHPLPGAFGKTSPADAAAGQSLSAALSWSDSSNAASCEYCVDTTNDNACSGSWTSTGSESSASPSGLLFNTTYYWQVRAKNARGTTNADSGSWFSFRTSAQLGGTLAWHYEL
jgi:hypothetical protein